MARVRVKLQWFNGAWGLLLPNYQMVPGSVVGFGPNTGHKDGILPDVDPNSPAVSAVICQVDIPDEETRPGGQLVDFGAIRQKYRDHPRFSREQPADQPQP